MTTFTTSEYIEENNLDVSPHDPRATRLIYAHLRSKGFRKIVTMRGRKRVRVWTDEEHRGLDELKDKLSRL